MGVDSEQKTVVWPRTGSGVFKAKRLWAVTEDPMRGAWTLSMPPRAGKSRRWTWACLWCEVYVEYSWQGRKNRMAHHAFAKQHKDCLRNVRGNLWVGGLVPLGYVPEGYAYGFTDMELLAIAGRHR